MVERWLMDSFFLVAEHCYGMPSVCVLLQGLCSGLDLPGLHAFLLLHSLLPVGLTDSGIRPSLLPLVFFAMASTGASSSSAAAAAAAASAAAPASLSQQPPAASPPSGPAMGASARPVPVGPSG